MKTNNLFLIFLLVTIFFLAQSCKKENEELAVSEGSAVEIPTTAQKISDNVFYLGKAVDPETGKEVEGYAIVHPDEQTFFSNKTAGSTCYAFFAEGAKWKTAEPWLFNPANNRGIPWSPLYSIMKQSAWKWKDAADGIVGNGRYVNIFGTPTMTSSALTLANEPDGKNESFFGSIAEPGTIAITIVWGIFEGPVESRQLLEWEMVFDQVDYNWSTNGAAGKMDFDNVATHEFGHACGLGDLYDVSCSEETEFGYSNFGETKRRTLNAGDIEGISTLY